MFTSWQSLGRRGGSRPCGSCAGFSVSAGDRHEISSCQSPNLFDFLSIAWSLCCRTAALSLQCPLLGKTGSKICCHPNEPWASQHHYSISFDVKESEGRLPHVLAFQQCQGRVSISKECTETANASKLCFTSSSGLFFFSVPSFVSSASCSFWHPKEAFDWKNALCFLQAFLLLDHCLPAIILPSLSAVFFPLVGFIY